MNIKIGKQIKNNLKNCYVLKHSYMIGDADGYDEFDNIISKENPFLIPYLEFLSSLGREISYEYVDEFMYNLDNKIDMYNEFIYEIDFDVRTESDLGWYSYQGYSISFYDENGNEFEVEITE